MSSLSTHVLKYVSDPLVAHYPGEQGPGEIRVQDLGQQNGFCVHQRATAYSA